MPKAEDLTRTILLSIIIEQEQADSEAEVFSNDLLAQLIRVYDMTSPLPLSRYLEQGTQLMLEQQNAYKASGSRRCVTHRWSLCAN